MSRIGTHIVGTSVEGRAIEAVVMGEGPATVLVLAGIHGDETAGTLLAQRLREYLSRYPELLTDRRLVLIPEVNPDGGVRGTRENFRGVDINRNFDTRNWTDAPEHGVYPLSEPETQAVVRAVAIHKPVRVIALHQPLACIDYDGPGLDLARYMADFAPLPIQKLGAQPGSFGSFAGLLLGIPIITYELPQGAEFLTGDLLWERYGFALIAALRYPVEEKERAYASRGYDKALTPFFPAAR